MVFATAEPRDGVAVVANARRLPRAAATTDATGGREAASRVRKRSMVGRLEIRCVTCRYGAIADQHPERCPMCGNDVWEFVVWRPFSDRDANGADRAAIDLCV